MRPHRADIAVIAFAAVAFANGCDTIDRARTRFGNTTTDTVVTATGSALALGLQAPPALRPGDEGTLRLSLTNQSDSVVSQVRLELIVPAWVEPVPPRPGDRPVTMSALETGATQFSYRMDDTPLTPGQVQSVVQRIRVPVSGISSRGNAPWTRTVRARLVAADGRTLAEVQTEIAVDSAAIAAATSTTAANTIDRQERVGPVGLGMTAAAVKQADPNARDTSWSQAGARQHGLIVPVGGRTALAILSGDAVARIEVGDAAIRTAEGTGVGSRIDELRAAYGSPCLDAVAGRVVVRFAAAPSTAFALDAAAPRNRAQLDATRIPATARVTRWWLSRDLEPCVTGG